MNGGETKMSRIDRPDFEAWFVIEVDVDSDRDNPLYTSMRGPFPTREDAERERDAQQEAWESALEEWDGENPYEFKGWDIVEKLISDHQIDNLERENEESYRVRREAADALAASMLADEGIGPMAGNNS